MSPAGPLRGFAGLTERRFLAAMLVLFAAVSVQYTLKIVEVRDGKQERSAILRWRDQLRRLDVCDDIYAHNNYPNPPIMALMLRPLAELPPIAGGLVWFYLKVGMALTAYALTFRLIEEPGRPFPSWAKALTVLVSLRPVMSDLTHGNVNLFILFLVVAALAAYRRGWDVCAGIIMALAVACKVTPALFIPYFAWKRSWRALAGVAIGLALFFVAIPGAILGWKANAELLGSWAQQMVTPYLVGGVVTSEHSNQSLPGLVHRLLTASPSFSTYVDNEYTPTEYHNLLTLSPGAAGWVVKGCMAAFAAFVVSSCRTPTRPRERAALAAEYALIVLGMLLFSERTWKHHAVTLLLPFGVVCYALTGPIRSRLRIALIVILVASEAALATTSTGLLPDDWGKLGQVYGAYTGAFILLAVAMVAILRAAAPPAPVENAATAIG
jgi:alpha-1,2-mannosyltransferase